MAVLEFLPNTRGMLILSVLGVFTVYYITTAILAWYRLRHFRGPFLASFSSLWLFRTAISGKAYQIHVATRRRYGCGLLRISPDTLITDDPEIFQQINAVRSGYARGKWYSVMRLDPHVHNMISSQDVAFHDDIKTRTTAGYSGREVPSMEQDVDGQIENLKRLLRRKYLSTPQKTRPLEWSLVAQYFTLDSLTKVAYGEEFGCLAADADVKDYIKTVENAGFLFAVCSDVPWMGKIFLSEFMLKLIGPKKTDKKGMGVMMALAEKIVSARFGPNAKDQQDMLGSFVRHGLPRKQCEAEIQAHWVAGSDSSANYIRIALLLLATTPRVYARLQKEIDDGIASSKISTPVTGAEGKSLPYLQAFLWESMRYHPPVNMLFSKVVPPEGDTLAGKFVPGGTSIAIDTWSLGRRTDVYGEDVSVFRPERFLEASPEKRLEMERTTELIFGSGRYMCSGKNLAFLEIHKLFVELLRDFDFQSLNPEMPFTTSHRSMFVIRNIWMRVTERVK